MNVHTVTCTLTEIEQRPTALEGDLSSVDQELRALKDLLFLYPACRLGISFPGTLLSVNTPIAGVAKEPVDYSVQSFLFFQANGVWILDDGVKKSSRLVL